MKSLTEHLTFNIPSRMGFVNITPQVEEAAPERQLDSVCQEYKKKSPRPHIPWAAVLIVNLIGRWAPFD